MERSSSVVVVNGGIRLPIGYRFRPTEEELLVHYLKRKAFGFPLPALVIPEFDVFTTDPWSLPGDLKEKNRYFFSKRSMLWINGSTTGSGFWKPIGKEKTIVASSGSNNQILGSRKSLAFFESKKIKKPSHDHDHHRHHRRRRAIKTRWIIHEYHLSSPPITQMCEVKYEDDWSVYCVFERKRKPRRCQKKMKKEVEEEDIISRTRNTSVCIDFPVVEEEKEDSSGFGPPPPSSPSSINGATEEEEEDSSGFFSKELNHQEETSSSAHQFFSFCNSN